MENDTNSHIPDDFDPDEFTETLKRRLGFHLVVDEESSPKGLMLMYNTNDGRKVPAKLEMGLRPSRSRHPRMKYVFGAVVEGVPVQIDPHEHRLELN